MVHNKVVGITEHESLILLDPMFLKTPKGKLEVLVALNAIRRMTHRATTATGLAVGLHRVLTALHDDFNDRISVGPSGRDETLTLAAQAIGIAVAGVLLVDPLGLSSTKSAAAYGRHRQPSCDRDSGSVQLGVTCKYQPFWSAGYRGEYGEAS
ncbi:uncharacterized protein DNG_06681 [Cephalotrichum gorgonifer]|uniref:Uncharacterized protein n=1 Tax=Cephalotrichum gorgonifer TaxID=2041049 RepID=A0AAE8N2X4_9PEZI|nr:uncharacterized protein DNG_06681 [Cephalotrichum gorgonifer]